MSRLALRCGKTGLSASDVASRTVDARNFDVTQALYAVLFTTGALDPTHVANSTRLRRSQPRSPSISARCCSG